MQKVHENFNREEIKIFSINTEDTAGKIKKRKEIFRISHPLIAGKNTGLISAFKLKDEDLGLVMVPWIYIFDKNGRLNTSEPFLEYFEIEQILKKLNNASKIQN